MSTTSADADAPPDPPDDGGSSGSGTDECIVVRDDGAEIYGVSWGARDAPAILVLDGIGCSGWAFKRIFPALQTRYRVLFMHYRGHGKSPMPPRPWRLGMHDLADDAAALLERFGVDSAAIVGFSMGFQVALELYKRHRPRVRALASLAGPSGRPLAFFQRTEAFDHLLPFVRMATRTTRDLSARIWRRLLPSKWLRVIGLHTQLNPARIELADLDIYLNQMAQMSPELFIDMLQEAARHCSDDILPRVRVPTLVMAGAHDNFIPIETLRKTAFSIPNATWVVVPEASHALPAEFYEEVTEQLMEFCAPR